jgi:hypothetical protein
MITGSEMQQLVLHINNEVALTVGMGSKTPLHKFFSSRRMIWSECLSTNHLSGHCPFAHQHINKIRLCNAQRRETPAAGTSSLW